MDKTKKSIKILGIEDDEFIRIFLKDVFWLHGEKNNIEFCVVENISKAKEYLRQKNCKPDLIFLDLMLPEQEHGPLTKEAGFRFLEEIKSDPETKDIKVVIFSAYGDKALKDKALKLGAERFLIKGEHLPQELMQITQEVLKEKFV